jgi:hypothetical protein
MLLKHVVAFLLFGFPYFDYVATVAGENPAGGRLAVAGDSAAMDFPSTRPETKTKHMPSPPPPPISHLSPFEQCF